MFTGLIEEVGYVESYKKDLVGATLSVACSKVLQDAKIGDSISINGVCETVVSVETSKFAVKISEETLNVTNFSNLKESEPLNLERALTINSRLGGHIVSGHIDCVGILRSINKNSDFYDLSFEVPSQYSKYIVYKGSIAVNGISLTVSSIKNNEFSIAVIPHTYNNTNLKFLNVGDCVNIETDILARYVEKLLSFGDNRKESLISEAFLQENGFM